jgi:O-antigen/teichoic acid export membrane protein
MGTVLVRNVLSNVLGRGSSIVAWLVLTPFVLRTLGPERFGFWSLLSTLASTAVLLDLGLGSAITRFVAGVSGEREHEARQGALTTGALVAASLALAWSLTGLLARGALLRFAHVDGAWRSEAFTAAGTAVLAAGVGVLALVPGAALTGVHRLDLVNRVAVAAMAVQIGGSVWLLVRGAGLQGLALAMLLANLTTLVASTVLLRRVAPELTLAPRTVSWERVREQARFSAALQIISLGVLFQYQFPKFVLARGVSLAAAGEYELAYRVAFAAWSLPSLLLPALLPAFAEWSAQGRWEAAWALYDRSARYLLLLALPLAALLAASAPALYQAWLGPGHGNAAISLAVLMTLLGINVTTSVGCLFARAIGRPWIEARYHMFSFALQLVLAAWLVPKAMFLGALLAMLLSGLAGTAVFLWTFHRALGRSLGTFLLKTAAPPALIAFAGGGLSLAVGGACAAGHWGGARASALAAIALGTLAGAVAIGLGALWLGLVTRAELDDVLRRIPRSFGWR